ncbi:hypothetical protein [Flavobacterium sp.]|uniref:hypothetical protein n=1 Tax=Flavobacterium sp. TaxID=239 RepID=UPI0039E62B1E
MKKYLFLILIIFLVGKIRSQDLKESNYELVIENPKVFTEHKKIVRIDAILINKSKDTLRYLSRSCSWSNFYEVDRNRMLIDLPACDKDVETIVTLPPGESNSVKLDVNFPEGKSILNFKIGMHIVDPKSIKKIIFFNHTEISQKYIIVWSNKLKIKL